MPNLTAAESTFQDVQNAVEQALMKLDPAVSLEDGAADSAIYGLVVGGVGISVSLNVTP